MQIKAFAWIRNFSISFQLVTYPAYAPHLWTTIQWVPRALSDNPPQISLGTISNSLRHSFCRGIRTVATRINISSRPSSVFRVWIRRVVVAWWSAIRNSKVMNTDQLIERKAFLSWVEGLRVNSCACQIGHSFAKGSSLLWRFFERSCVACWSNYVETVLISLLYASAQPNDWNKKLIFDLKVDKYRLWKSNLEVSA